MNDSEKDAVLVLRIAKDLKVTEATIGAETVETLYNLIIRQYEKIDRLNIEINIETVKSEAVREFAEKLKTEITGLEAKSPNTTYKCGMEDVLYYHMPKIIDRLVKEMGCNDG